jgi:hypothetical protein
VFPIISVTWHCRPNSDMGHYGGAAVFAMVVLPPDAPGPARQPSSRSAGAGVQGAESLGSREGRSPEALGDPVRRREVESMNANRAEVECS